MEIFRAGTRPRKKASAEYFVGEVHRDDVISAPAPARLNAGHVHFSPGARTNWHTHPFGQTLYVTDGRGRAQVEGGPVYEIGPGDVIWFPPNTRHWHGASPDEAMSHVAMQEADENGKTINWMEPVSDEDYLTAPES